MADPVLAHEFLSRVSAPRCARPGSALRDVRNDVCPRFRARSHARVAEARHRVCATGPDPPRASSTDAATTTARDESARIQRDLASRLLAAQTGWVSAKKKPKPAAEDAPSVSDSLSNLGPRVPGSDPAAVASVSDHEDDTDAVSYTHLTLPTTPYV